MNSSLARLALRGTNARTHETLNLDHCGEQFVDCEYTEIVKSSAVGIT